MEPRLGNISLDHFRKGDRRARAAVIGAGVVAGGLGLTWLVRRALPRLHIAPGWPGARKPFCMSIASNAVRLGSISRNTANDPRRATARSKTSCAMHIRCITALRFINQRALITSPNNCQAFPSNFASCIERSAVRCSGVVWTTIPGSAIGSSSSLMWVA